MKKCLPISLLVSLLCFGTACNPVGTTSSSSTGGQVSSPISQGPTVTGVTIDYDGETAVLGGSSVKLTANVLGIDGGKVTWTSSNEEAATVKNGTVSFKNVSSDTEVTITATSKDDDTKSATVTFTVKYTEINFANSRGSFDNSLYLDEGTVEITEPGDSALLFNGVYGTKWYVEAEITPTAFSETDQYPKFGIMTGTDKGGYWNSEGSKNLFYFVDAVTPASNNSWTVLGLVGQNDELSDWDWGRQTGASVTGDNKIVKGEANKLGLMRDGEDYWMFAGKGDNYSVIKHTRRDAFAADEATYAWIGGWSTAYTVANVKSVVGDDVDSKYDAVEGITFGTTSQTLYIGDTYQLDYDLGTDFYNPKKLTFTSSDENIATVSNTGLITAGQTAGTAEIKAIYEDKEATFTLKVTTDATFSVLLDGEMNDLLWSETVKSNVVKLYNGSGTNLIDIYASRNTKGLYFYIDYKTNADHTGNGEWWQGDNIEFRLTGVNGLLVNSVEVEPNLNQFRIGRYSSGVGHNLTDAYATALTLNEETGMYEMKMELFISYAQAGITADDKVGFTAGANPGGSGWYCEGTFASGNIFDTHKITTSGATKYFDTCTGEHEYDSKITTPVTCVDNGVTTYTCKWCGHSYTEDIIAAGVHNYNEPIETITVATCTTEGVGHRGCSGCDAYEEVSLPIDITNHDATGAYIDGKWTCCGNALEETLVYDYKYPDGGAAWLQNNFNIGTMSGTADWTIEVEVEQHRRLRNADCARGWAGQIEVEDENGDFSNGDENKWWYRPDWWGNGKYNNNHGNGYEGNCGVWDGEEVFTNGFNDYIESVLNDCYIKQTISFSHDTGVVTVVTKVTALEGSEAGKTTTITYTSLAFPKDKNMRAYFGMQWGMDGTHTFKSIKYTGTVVSAYNTAGSQFLVTNA